MKNISSVAAFILIATITAGHCLGQPESAIDNPDDVTTTNRVQGVELVISITKKVINIGSEIVISAKITNEATNAITVHVMDPRADFDVYITKKSGETLKISREPSGAVYGASLPILIKSGDSHEWRIPATIAKNIEPGDYSLKVAKRVRGNGKVFKIESNVLKVKIQ